MTEEGTVLAYKVLGEKGEAFHGGTGRWHLPKNGKPGKWMQVKGEIVPCENGLHLCRKQDLIYWLGPAIWVAEYEGEPVAQSDKIVVSKARLIAPTNWNARTQRLFAADCAAYAIRQPRKAGINPDQRSLDAIRIARRYAEGKAGGDELAAASAAAWAAASAAERAAASAAARAAARAWQTKRLFHYLATDEQSL